ncbi:MAG: 3-keto-5-aminohexanoate cleavage protein [Treponemataceae bacterium]
MEKLIITVATTGGVTTREKTPYIPLDPKEIADEVYACWKAGAAIAHIHVRDKNGKPSLDFDTYKETVQRIKDKCDIVLNLTTSGGLDAPDEVRIKPVELLPELASFDAGSVNFGPAVFQNSMPFLEKLAKAMQEKGVKPEVEVFEAGMINNALMIADKGLIKKPMHFQFVLGVPGAMPGNPKNLLHLVETIPADSTWSVIGVGKSHLPLSVMAIHMGGHVRVGMEDNVYLKRGVLAKSNTEFVERVVRIADEFERPIATPAEARGILGLRT